MPIKAQIYKTNSEQKEALWHDVHEEGSLMSSMHVIPMGIHLEFQPYGVNKASAIRKLLAHSSTDFTNEGEEYPYSEWHDAVGEGLDNLQLERDVVAFGDNTNDLEMLEASALGIVVKNVYNEKFQEKVKTRS